MPSFNIVLVITAVVTVGLSWYFYSYPPPNSLDRGVCPADFTTNTAFLTSSAFINSHDNFGECFFPSNYEDGVKRFQEAAAKLGAKVTAKHVVDNLSNHIAIVQGNPKKFLVHISGTHGPESYIGSATQNAVMQHLAATRQGNLTTELDPTIVFVHALNPYGFKTGRRTNEESIDLNRNFLTPEEWKETKVHDPNYAGHITFGGLLNPTTLPFKLNVLNEIYLAVYAAVMQLLYSKRDIKKALVTGNYNNPLSYGFGGLGPSQSAKNLVHLLLDELQIPQVAEKVALIDVHTGLGPTGVDTLIHPAFMTPDFTEKVFPTEYLSENSATGGLKTNLGNKEVKGGNQDEEAAAAVGAGYELTKGTVTDSFCAQVLTANLPDTSRVCVAQEFGTVPEMIVGVKAIVENYAFHYGTPEERDKATEDFKACFYVETKTWKRRTLHRGITLFLQALDFLRTAHPSEAVA